MQNKTPLSAVLLATLAAASMAACTPTVQVAPPDKPIEINLNIKIDQEVRVKVEKDLDAAIASNPDLFGTSASPAPTAAKTAKK